MQFVNVSFLCVPVHEDTTEMILSTLLILAVCRTCVILNFIIDLHCSLCGSMIEHWSRESEGLRFDSSWGLRIFSLSHAHDKMKSIFLK